MKKLLILSTFLFSTAAAIAFILARKNEEEESSWEDCGHVFLPKELDRE